MRRQVPARPWIPDGSGYGARIGTLMLRQEGLLVIMSTDRRAFFSVGMGWVTTTHILALVIPLRIRQPDWTDDGAFRWHPGNFVVSIGTATVNDIDAITKLRP